MVATDKQAPTPADRLLDAQVAWVLDELTGADAAQRLPAYVDDVLAVAAVVRVEQVVEPEELAAAVHALTSTVPGSAFVSTVVEAVADAVHEGPSGPVTLDDLADREQLVAVLDALLARTDELEALLDDLTRSPEAAGLAATFLTRVVAEVVQANRAVAEKIPGVGSLVSFGASAAGKVMGAADRQVEQLVGGTAGKGAVIAMRRLNAVLLATLRDPGTRDALVGVLETYADRPLPRPTGDVEEVRRVAGTVQDLVIGVLASEPARELTDGVVRSLVATYGPHTLAEVLDDLGVGRDEIAAVVTTAGPRLLAVARESGELERIVRARLAPFFASDEVAEILG
ncbi:hypothetical protein [Nocardioides zeae]|uniref:Uncharacterized protein n=1 Tax=Nocardioides zeae TaxID=1457234 RepID=A0AAJ1U520_9ACTN|nr:hypothetical protein [Nocardioides zeae]MDQ1104591.1 hypothetical protein [Nocardioides zeae]